MVETIVMRFGFGRLRVPALIPLSTVNWIWESETPSNSSSLTNRSLPEPTYDLGEGHPLLGRRMPDLDLNTADGPLRVFELLHDARPLLLDLGQPGDLDIAPWADRI